MNAVAQETNTDTDSTKKKSKSVFKAYKGMVSTFLSGLKDLTTDSVPDHPRHLPVDNTNSQNGQQSKMPTRSKADPVSTPDSEKQSQESDSSTNSTPTFPRKNTAPTPKTNSKDQKKSRRENPFRDRNPFNLRANSNQIWINNSENIRIGPTFKQVFNNTCTTTSSASNIKKTTKIQALLRDCTPISTNHLDIVSTHVGHKWRIVGRILNFTDAQLDQFELQAHFQPKEVVYQMLLAWTQEYPKEAILGKLCSSLWKADEKEAVQKLAENITVED